MKLNPYLIENLRRIASGWVLRRSERGSLLPRWYWGGGSPADHYSCNAAVRKGLIEGSDAGTWHLTDAGRAALAEAQKEGGK